MERSNQRSYFLSHQFFSLVNSIFKRLVNFIVTLWKNKRGTDAVFKVCTHWRVFGIPVLRHHLTLYGVGPCIQKHPMKKTRIHTHFTTRPWEICERKSTKTTEMKKIAHTLRLIMNSHDRKYLVSFDMMMTRKKTAAATTHRWNAMKKKLDGLPYIFF